MSGDNKNIDATVQQNLRNFAKILPTHVEAWRSALQESADPVRALLNQAEQLRSVEA